MTSPEARNLRPACNFGLVEHPVIYRRKIRFSDSDAQGIVFNANYLRYVDDAITDYFDALPVGWTDMQARGYELVLGRAELSFRSSARIGETLATSVKVVQIGTTSVTFGATIVEEGSGRLVVEGREVQVMVDSATFEKKPVPAWFVEAVEELQGSVEWKGRT